MTLRGALGALLLSGALAAATLPSVGTTATAAPAPAPATSRPSHGAEVDRVPAPKVDWARCGQRSDMAPAPRRAQCADVKVPLDYDAPRGEQTTLHLLKMPATGPQRRRIGTLFVNPGGPGGPSSQFAPYAAQLLGERVSARFDVVGIDPRGTGLSGHATCAGRLAPYPRVAYPHTAAEAKKQLAFDARLRTACAKNGSTLLDHVSTADNARDMDLLRRALGDDQLSYYGISYGSYLGATYAAMFPDRVRALVVDGVLDPVAWSTGNPSKRKVTTPFSTRIASGPGSTKALLAAFADCRKAGERKCSIAKGPRAAWERVLKAAEQGRIEDGAATYQDVVGLAVGSLYDRTMIPWLMDFIGELEAGIDAPPTARRSARVAELRERIETAIEQRPTGPWGLAARGDAMDVQGIGVMCSDTRNPRSPRAWVTAAKRADRQAPWFGSYWTWLSSPCAKQGIGDPADAFSGPWRTRTSTPLLVVGNTYDPATPINGAKKVHQLFADSRLVRYDGYGHGAIGTSACATGIMSRYLLSEKLPKDRTVCQARGLWAPPAPAEVWPGGRIAP